MSPAEIRDALIVARSRVVGAPVVHAIGDSHTVMLTGVWPFVAHYIAPVTAYNLASLTSSTQSRTRLLEALRHADPRRDIVLLIAGGTDCRLHIHDQHVRSSGRRSLEELAHETVVRYGRAIDLVRARGFRVAAHSLVGAAHAEEHGYDHSGDIRVRGRITQLFSAELQGVVPRAQRRLRRPVLARSRRARHPPAFRGVGRSAPRPPGASVVRAMASRKSVRALDDTRPPPSAALGAGRLGLAYEPTLRYAARDDEARRVAPASRGREMMRGTREAGDGSRARRNRTGPGVESG